MLHRIWPCETALVQEAVRAFFKRIAMPFSVHASGAVLETQAHAIRQQIPRTFDTRLAMSRSSFLSSCNVHTADPGEAHEVSAVDASKPEATVLGFPRSASDEGLGFQWILNEIIET